MEPTSKTSMRLGDTTVILSDDTFQLAFKQGYYRFHADFKGKAITDTRIYGFIAQAVMDSQTPDCATAGYIVGFVAALLQTDKQADSTPVANWQQALELEW